MITVSVSPSGCDTDTASWTASTISNFVTLNPTSGTGNGTVTMTVPANPFMTPLTGNLSIAGLLVPFVQLGSGGAAFCSAQRVRGGDVPVTRTIDVGRPSGRVRFQFDNGSESADRLVVSYEGRALLDTGCVATAGPRTEYLTFSGRSTKLTVQVFPNCRGGSGSTWTFETACSQ